MLLYCQQKNAIHVFLVCKTFDPKIWSCKFFEKNSSLLVDLLVNSRMLYFKRSVLIALTKTHVKAMVALLQCAPCTFSRLRTATCSSNPPFHCPFKFNEISQNNFFNFSLTEKYSSEMSKSRKVIWASFLILKLSRFGTNLMLTIGSTANNNFFNDVPGNENFGFCP